MAPISERRIRGQESLNLYREAALASIHPIAEKAHSRKLVFIHPHTYKVPGRRQAGLFSELPSKVILGNYGLPAYEVPGSLSALASFLLRKGRLDSIGLHRLSLLGDY